MHCRCYSLCRLKEKKRRLAAALVESLLFPGFYYLHPPQQADWTGSYPGHSFKDLSLCACFSCVHAALILTIHFRGFGKILPSFSHCIWWGGKESGKGSGQKNGHNGRANRVKKRQRDKKISALCLLLLSPSFSLQCLIVCCQGWVAKGHPGDFQNLNKCRGCRPLTPSRPKGGLVSLQLPESEQDQGVWPLTHISVFLTNLTSVTLGQRVPITRLPSIIAQLTFKRQLLARESNWWNSVLWSPKVFPPQSKCQNIEVLESKMGEKKDISLTELPCCVHSCLSNRMSVS